MLYYAYGSNLSLAQMRERCPGATPLRTHRLEGLRLVLRGVADIEDAPGEAIEGALYEVTEEHAAILDGFEGAPTLYDRRTFEVEEGTAMYYRMVEPRFKEPRPGYVGVIAQGYADWGLPLEALELAKERQLEQYGMPA